MIYLIDFENVHSDGLKGIEQLGKKDKCYIFYSCLLYTSPSPRDS